VPLGDAGGVEVGQTDAAVAGLGVDTALGEADAEAVEVEIAELDEELPELEAHPGTDAKVEKLPVKKPAARRRPTPAKKPAPSGKPEVEAEED